MFVVDANKGGSEFPECIRHIAGLLTRHEAEIERIERWEERKLAYPIKRAKRGIYILTYFRADGAAISELRRDIALSEDILRVLIIRPDEVSPVQGQLFSPEGEEIESPAEAADEPAAQPAAEPAAEDAAAEADSEPDEEEAPAEEDSEQDEEEADEEGEDEEES
jgi:small subunit ribosomal protein S6